MTEQNKQHPNEHPGRVSLSQQHSVVAEFATRAFAQDAQRALEAAGFDQVSIDVAVTPEQMQAVSTQAVAAMPPAATPSGTLPVTPAIVQTLEANATARLVVHTEREADAIAIIKDKGGKVFEEKAQTAEAVQDEIEQATKQS